MRRFNVTGTCVGTEHYMVDISAKLDEIKKLVDSKAYFTINRARQYGKTTTLHHLKKRLEESGDYICVSITFENAGMNAFDTEETFCNMFLRKISKALKFSSADKDYAKKWLSSGITSFNALDEHITENCEDHKLVLMIDEVDKSSNNQLFLHFLGLLRSKFLLRQVGEDYTFHSVILAGVTNIKNLKMKIVNDGQHEPLKQEGRVANSPWNIAANFNVDMSFSPEEISTMLHDYESENKTGKDAHAVAYEIHKHTNGYPFLVSRICQCIDEELGKNWTIDGVNQAVRIVVDERNTLLDDMVKNLENNDDFSNFMYELLILGIHKSFKLSNKNVDLAYTYAYIKKDEKAKAVISNKIFESYLTDYFVTKGENSSVVKRLPGVIYQDVIKGGRFDMAACLIKFAEFYSRIYSHHDEVFFERHGRLLFLSFLAPLVNGQGFYHIETALTDQRRMDLAVDFEKEQYIVELKRWDGSAAKERAYEQLLGYMEAKGVSEGYLLTFDFRKNKTGEHKAGWVEVGDRRVFDVVV